MRLSQLLSIYPQLKWGQDPNTEVIGLTRDSREVKKGMVFVAVRGTQRDGHADLPEVCAKSAAAVIVERDDRVPRDYTGAIVVVPDTRDALDRLASRFYGNPAENLFCVGVTGTNGKTTVTYLVESIFQQFGWRTGVMGTINHHLGDHVWNSELTTPDPLTLQKRLSEFRALNADAAAFEVSSHALKQRRADAIPFDVAVFTNLSRDHLDYHQTMEDYFAAKERLFFDLLSESSKSHCWAILNSDDPWGRKIHVADRARIWTYGQGESDFRFRVESQTFSGTAIRLFTPRGEEEVRLGLPGLHNAYNAVAAVAVGIAAGASLDVCVQGIAQFRGVPGRLQRVELKRPINVFVDFAHTDDALRSVLQSLNEIRKSMKSTARIITVFGCGGDRDKGKRPLMMKVAMDGSDLVFVTSDNPRTEDPERIIDDILAGVAPEQLNQKIFREADRKRAIDRALQSAMDGDVILIAGKGHENYQQVGQEKLPFSDADCVKELCS